MQYHNLVESVPHRAGFWFFTIIPAMFAMFWTGLILLAYEVIA